MNQIFDLYTDYIIGSFQQITATGLSKVIDNALSHDKITRMLSSIESDSKALWLNVKSIVRENETEEGCLIFDDTLVEKPYTDENEIICWHYDHCSGKNIKGINLLTTFYYSQKNESEMPIKVPIGFDIITKYPHSSELETKKVKRKSLVTKNELMRQQISVAINNNAKFSYILADSWFSSSENMKFIHAQNKYFIFDLKNNRLASTGDRNEAKWLNISNLDLQDNVPIKVWLKDVEISILLIKQVFKNKDGSIGERYLASNNLNLTGDEFGTTYKKRWSIEEFHKSVKQNSCIAKSPTGTVKTQKAHIFASIISYIKLERYKLSTKLNHFALKNKIYIKAMKVAFAELLNIKQQYGINEDYSL
ncbi:MAG: transposase [Patescibacteria group bacterium]